MAVSSVAGRIPSPVSASYAMSKHALHGFFDTLRLEVAPRGVAITLVCPGPVQSNGAEHAFTGTAGVAVGATRIDDSKKMTGARFAALLAAAVHARVTEAWISRQPILLSLYAAQWLPGPAMRAFAAAAASRVAAFRAGDKCGRPAKPKSKPL